MNFHERKRERTEWNHRFVYGWKQPSAQHAMAAGDTTTTEAHHAVHVMEQVKSVTNPKEQTMNKLTAEKCREQFEYWAKSFGREPDLTRANGGANYANSEIDVAWLAWKASRQALEIALPVLEQQESPTDTYRQIENDGWIEWKGGERPVDSGTIVQVKFRSVSCILALDAWEFDWNHYGNASDIIAYRVIENDGREG